MPFNNREEEELVRVGPGTPSGEVFRRYWLPVEVSANLGPKYPMRVQALGEDLVLFRDSSAQPGLLAEHCSHRGTSLYYGRVEGDCLRCLYHGWAYDAHGNVVDTPAEPPTSNFKYTVKHRAYPCLESAGLIFAYMGPPEKQPLFPRYEPLVAEDGIRLTGNGAYVEGCNVFQALHDNNLDAWHVEIAHGWFSARPRDAVLHHGRDGEPPSPVKYERTPLGTRYVTVAPVPASGKYRYFANDTIWPCSRCNNDPRRGSSSLEWAVPLDDQRTRWFNVRFFPFVDGKPSRAGLTAANSASHARGNVDNLPADWAEQVGRWDNFAHPWRQGNLWEDEVAQATQGSRERGYLPDWENWHLGTSDHGLMLNREVWREQVERVRQGLDPIGVIRDPRDDRIIPNPSITVWDLSWEEAVRLFEAETEVLV